MTFLIPESEQSRVTQAIQAAESRTTGEIVVCELDASWSYPFARVLWGIVLMFAVSAGMIVGVATGAIPLWAIDAEELALFASIQAISLGLGAALGGWSPLKRAMVPKKIMESAVRERAAQAFIDHGLSATHDRNGVLILLSRFERRVQVLADRGIDQKVPAGMWDRGAKTITDGIRSGHSIDSLIQVIQQVGEQLATHFPKTPEDTNELSDEVRRS